MLTLADIIEALQGYRPTGLTTGISEAVIDSRQAVPGSLFVAIKGERTDGHAYVSDAFRNGAHLALVDKPIDPTIPVVDLTSPLEQNFTFPALPFALRVGNTVEALQNIAAFWRSRFNVRVIGITGSVGKSTTKELIAEILGKRYRTLKNQGNLNNEIGLPLTLLRLGPGYQQVVLEMGFYEPGDIDLLCRIAKPQVGVITNIGTVHASRAKSQAAIARGKSELVQSLPAAPAGVAILNKDDPLVVPMQELTNASVFFYGLDSHADLWADEIESQGLDGIRFRIHYKHETFSLQAPLIGRHSIHTILRAVSVALVEGLSWGEIITGLHQASSQLRLVVVQTRQGALLLDDTYNASPESMLAALNLLHELSGRRIAVLGGMNELGPYEQSGHRRVGMRAAEVADHLITFQQNGLMLHDAALSAGFPAARLEHMNDKDKLIARLDGMLEKGDIVLIKGSHSLRMDEIVQALEVKE